MGIVTMLSKIDNSQAVSATASMAIVLRVTAPVAMLSGTITWGVRLALYHRCAMHFLHPNAVNNPHPLNIDCQEALSKACLRTLGLINQAPTMSAKLTGLMDSTLNMRCSECIDSQEYRLRPCHKPGSY